MATNSIRFPVFGGLKRLLQDGDAQNAGPLPPSQALLAGGSAGAISAVVTQPIDTVMAQAQGLESKRFRSTWHCARELVAAGGAYAALVAAQANVPAPRAQASAPARLGLASSPSASHSDDETNDEDEDDVRFSL